MSLTIKDLQFTLDYVAMGPPLGTTLAYAFLVYYEPEPCSLDCRPSYYQRNPNDICVLVNSSEHLKRFQSFLNSCHVVMFPDLLRFDQFHLEVVKLMDVSGYPENFINNYFKMFLDNKHRIQ